MTIGIRSDGIIRCWETLTTKNEREMHGFPKNYLT
jgi:hypothetical protein